MDGSGRPEREPKLIGSDWFGWFERLIDPFKPAAEPAPPRALGSFWRWGLADVRAPLVALGVLSLAVGAVEAGVFWMIGALVDRAEAAGPEAFFDAERPYLAVLLVALVVVRPLATLAQNALSSLALGPALQPMTIWRLHRHTLGQAMRFFEEDFTGRLAQKQMQTANALTQATLETLNALGMMIAFVVTMVAALAAADWRLALIATVWAALYVGALWVTLPVVRARAKARAEARAGVTGRLVDSLSHIKTVKLFAHATREEESARQALTRFRDSAVAFGRPLMAMRVMLAILNTVAIVALIGLALWLWTEGAATLGVVATAAMLTLRATAMSNWIAFSAMTVFGEIGTVEDGAITLSPAHGVTDRPGALAAIEPRGRIRFEGVRFAYGRPSGGVGPLDLTIEPGEKVALVGPSGAGKSTTVALLLRLYDVEAGRITLDGVDLRDMTQDALRRAVGAVTQETAIFNRSALDNILYGRPEAGREAATMAAKKARAHEFLAGLRDGRGRTGYDAHLGERGVKLSGGQRQRVALARAILKDAPILVLDEATSALDSAVEAEIQAALHDVMEGKTVLAIAHRLSTIAEMDRIVVMDGGRVVEQGPHARLLAGGGLYAALWARQSGGFIGADA
ncbi:MAG: ABC transporter ATP-binding protein [Rhodobacteraceae bacterium]|nr:MAG: ABC transporter ATP-binding protein [Paracoccaceae bacterium]